MRSYFVSLIVGLAVGVVYGLVKVRSPAPPAIALLGMLAGEQSYRSSVRMSSKATSNSVRHAILAAK